MYEREVDVPRLIGHFRLDSPSAALPVVISEAGRRVSDTLGAPFNSVGLNLYRDGRDSLVMDHATQLHYTRKRQSLWASASAWRFA